MKKTAIIGGSGLDQLQSMHVIGRKVVRTPFGDPSGILIEGTLFDKKFVFLPRHGLGHTIPPHKVNYRANIWALKQSGVQRIVAFAAVGGVNQKLKPESIVIPDQLIDYTWGREHTYFDGSTEMVRHIDFTHPYSQVLRKRLIKAGSRTKTQIIDGATYGVTQGPRLETPAEIRKMMKQGVDIVGMTGMPEAALAQELGIDYACVAIVVNPAAGLSGNLISMDSILQHLKSGTTIALGLLKGF